MPQTICTRRLIAHIHYTEQKIKFLRINYARSMIHLYTLLGDIIICNKIVLSGCRKEYLDEHESANLFTNKHCYLDIPHPKAKITI